MRIRCYQSYRFLQTVALLVILLYRRITSCLQAFNYMTYRTIFVHLILFALQWFLFFNCSPLEQIHICCLKKLFIQREYLLLFLSCKRKRVLDLEKLLVSVYRQLTTLRPRSILNSVHFIQRCSHSTVKAQPISCS